MNFLHNEKPEYVFLAAAKVGGILANSTYPAEFIYENLMIEANIIHASYKYGVKKLLFLGSSCIYPKLAPQPLKEEYLINRRRLKKQMKLMQSQKLQVSGFANTITSSMEPISSL